MSTHYPHGLSTLALTRSLIIMGQKRPLRAISSLWSSFQELLLLTDESFGLMFLTDESFSLMLLTDESFGLLLLTDESFGLLLLTDESFSLMLSTDESFGMLQLTDESFGLLLLTDESFGLMLLTDEFFGMLLETDEFFGMLLETDESFVQIILQIASTNWFLWWTFPAKISAKGCTDLFMRGIGLKMICEYYELKLAILKIKQLFHFVLHFINHVTFHIFHISFFYYFHFYDTSAQVFSDSCFLLTVGNMSRLITSMPTLLVSLLCSRLWYPTCKLDLLYGVALPIPQCLEYSIRSLRIEMNLSSATFVLLLMNISKIL